MKKFLYKSFRWAAIYSILIAGTCTFTMMDTFVLPKSMANTTAVTTTSKTTASALANNTYGRNITETTSDMAEANNAIFAINGDYYGFRDGGYVLRNGVEYRGTARSGDNDALVMGGWKFIRC